MVRTFDTFTFEEIQELFGIERNDELQLLQEWINISPIISDEDRPILIRLKKHLFKQILNWNEDELKMFFIGPLIEFADLETKNFKPFTQRMLNATISGIEVNGKVDFMIAKGLRTAKPPYFCIHEYKQEIGSDGEPLGQLLIAMLASQTLNEHKFPILGAYIVGRNWFFVVLVEKEYAVSKAFDASDEDIFQIFAILQKSKEIMSNNVGIF